MGDDIGMASAAWHALGHQLGVCRRAAGLNQEGLAALTAYSRSSIANVETGRQRVGLDFWRRCDDVLGTGDALQRGFSEARAAARAERAQAVAAARYQSMTVTFGHLDRPVEPSAVTLAGGTGSASSCLPVMETGTAMDPLVVGSLADALAGHAQAAALFGGGELLPLMVRHVRFLRAGFASTRGAHRKRLILTCARYAEFAGWLSQDLARAGDAQFWTDHALEWAREAGDPEFVSYALMRQSDLAEGRGPARRVLDLAEAAAAVPTLGPRARALVIQQRATGHALDRDVARFERASPLHASGDVALQLLGDARPGCGGWTGQARWTRACHRSRFHGSSRVRAARRYMDVVKLADRSAISESGQTYH